MEKDGQKLSQARESVLKSLKAKIIFGILGLIFIALTGTFFYFKITAPAPIPIQAAPKKLINATEKIIQIKTASNISEDLKNALGEKISESAIQVFLLTENVGNTNYFLTEDDFFMKSGIRPHIRLNQSVTGYDLGAIGGSGNEKNSAFLLFEISSFENAVAGALSWEKSMPKELIVIFPELERSTQREFRDEVIKNQDVRVFESGAGKIFYTFFNKKIMIITGSRKTLGDILSRYEIFPPN